MKTSLLQSPLVVSVLLAMPVLLFGLYVATREPRRELSAIDTGVLRNRRVEVGGISRPASDLSLQRLRNRAARDGQATGSDSPQEKRSSSFGTVTCPKVPRLEPGRGAAMDSLIEAVQTGNYPERLSPQHAARPFDRAAWEADPQEYLKHYVKVAEPGRIYDVRQPGAGVPVLTSASSESAQLHEGESVRLVARTLAGAPVTFTIFATGMFANGISTTTVVADDDGLATAVFVGTTGPSSTDVVAGSPVTSGTLRYRIRVLPALATSQGAGRFGNAARGVPLMANK